MDNIALLFMKSRKEYMIIIALLVVLIIVAIFVMKPQRYFDHFNSESLITQEDTDILIARDHRQLSLPQI